MARSSFRSLFTCAAVASAATGLSLALWSMGLLTSLQHAFLLASKNKLVIKVPEFWVAALLIGLPSVAAAINVRRSGGRRAIPYLGGGFLGCAALSLFASWFFSADILFTPIALAASISAITMQVIRLSEHDQELTSKLIASTAKLDSRKANDAEHRLLSGLKLLDNVLSPTEAVVFRRDSAGKLVSSARLRVSRTSDTGRNSAWREGVSLCERAMTAGEIIVEQTESDDASTKIALPLQHEKRTVGALLLRVAQQFGEEDRALLTAVGGQMARNLQREEADNDTGNRSPLNFFSARASQRRLESLYVLNGALLEQSVGVNSLSEIGDGVALAYLDGRIAYANPSLLALGSLTQEQTRNISFFDLLESFRTDVFDEPAIAVRRVLQTGEPYERELHFADRNETYGLRISLVKGDSRRASNLEVTRKDDEPQPLCLALVVKDVTLHSNKKRCTCGAPSCRGTINKQ